MDAGFILARFRRERQILASLDAAGEHFRQGLEEAEKLPAAGFRTLLSQSRQDPDPPTVQAYLRLFIARK